MTAQQTAANQPDYVEREIEKLGEAVKAGQEMERLRIRRALLAVGVIREGVWVYRESVIAAIKKATRAPGKGRR